MEQLYATSATHAVRSGGGGGTATFVRFGALPPCPVVTMNAVNVVVRLGFYRFSHEPLDEDAGAEDGGRFMVALCMKFV